MIKSVCHFRYLILLFVLPVLAAGQDAEIPETQIDLLPNDTARVNRLIELGESYCARNNQKALFYLQESLFLANELKYKKGIAWSYLWLGRVYYYKDEYELAITSLQKAKKMLDGVDDYFEMAFYYFALGSISNVRGNHVNALSEFQQMVYYGRLAGNKLYESAGTFALGVIHLNRGEYREAKKYMIESLAVKIEIGDQKGIANIYTSLGRLYEEQSLYDSAMFFYEKGFEIRKSNGDSRAIANSLNSIAKLEIAIGDFKPAIEKLKETENIYTDLDEKTGLCYTQMNLALAYTHTGAGDIANRYINRTLGRARQLQNPSILLDSYKIKSKMESVNGNYREAYQLAVKAGELQDSLNNANREEIIQEMEARYKLEQKNNEIELLNNRNNIQQKNIIILSISIGALIFIILLIIILFRLKAKSHLREKKLLEQEKTILEQQEKIKEKENLLLHEKVESKNRELATKAIEMLRVNETIGEVINRLDSMNHIYQDDRRIEAHIKEIARELEIRTNNNTWSEFDKIFKNIHNEFYENLLKACPALTASEIKIAALLKLNLSTKEIAAITYKSEEGIKSTRYRLRKKLNLNGDDKLIPFLMRL